MGDREDRDLEPVMWASGGNWDPPPPPASTSLPAEPIAPIPGKKPEARYGPVERHGAVGVVVGRFSPLHRGHQYLIDFARGSVRQLHVVVIAQLGDPIPMPMRAAWIRAQFPGVEVHSVQSSIVPGEADWEQRFAALVSHLVPARITHFFSSELPYRTAAFALGAQFVPVDPSRSAVPISASAIRANIMDNFHYLAPVTRPWFVRRVAVVGAESTGKTTLCARLREELGATVVPEWTRVLVESGHDHLTSDQIQLVARSQIASEDALALQPPGGTGGLLVCDTDLRSVLLWARRLFYGEVHDWISTAIFERPYDLYLLCAPDIPYVGPPQWDLPEERMRFHQSLLDSLQKAPVVELSGSREERFRTAADAIIGLFTPSKLFSARGLVTPA